MKKFKLSEKTMAYVWGITFTISAFLFIYIASLFAPI